MITASDVQTAGAKLEFGSNQLVFSTVVTDSRLVEPGALFVALPGERADGHCFLKDAVARGAAGLLVSKPTQERPENVALFSAADCLRTLGNLAGLYRLRIAPIVAGITGSCGKTTTKDFLASILERKAAVLKSQGNHNNELGLPLTLLSLRPEHKIAVVEMGMRGLGQIRRLCEIARPQLGVVTNVGQAHLELLGSRENIAKAKGELIESLPPYGAAILSGDDPTVRAMARLNAGKTMFFGFGPDNDLWAEPTGPQSAVFHYGSDRAEVTLPSYGLHNIANALAAAAAALALGYDLSDVAAGLARAQISDLRLKLQTSRGGWLILNDTYNAAPASSIAALEVLSQLGSQRKRRTVAVLADMLELGADSPELHRQVGAKAAETVGELVTVGELAAQLAQGALAAGMPAEKVHSFSTSEEARDYLLSELRPDALVLVKGSRAMRMDKIAQALRGDEEA